MTSEEQAKILEQNVGNFLVLEVDSNDIGFYFDALEKSDGTMETFTKYTSDTGEKYASGALFSKNHQSEPFKRDRLTYGVPTIGEGGGPGKGSRIFLTNEQVKTLQKNQQGFKKETKAHGGVADRMPQMLQFLSIPDKSIIHLKVGQFDSSARPQDSGSSLFFFGIVSR